MSTAVLVDEIARLRAENTELRLTLAAEQGKPEGAPDPAWTFAEIWRRDYPNHESAMVFKDGTWLRGRLTHGQPATRGKEANQRAGMKAADNLQRNTP